MNSFDHFLDSFLKARDVAGDIFGVLLPWFELFAVVVSAFLIYGIIYATIKSNWLVYKVDEWTDILGAGSLSKRRTLRGWRQILKRLETDKEQNWKIAVIEADKILAEMLVLNGYKAESVHDQLKKVSPTVLPNIEELKQAHKIRDRIVQEPDFSVSHDQTTQIIRTYANAFREFALID